MKTHLWMAAIVALGLGSTASLFAVAPTVVETTPQDGNWSVDPNLQEMRFVFDQDMSRDGFSICGGGIAPDIPVPVTPSQLQSGDPVVQAALDWLRAR